MSLEDVATINVSTTSAGVTRAGYGVISILSHTATWVERYRDYTSLSALGVDFPANTPEYMAASKALGQSLRVTKIRVVRAANVPTQRFAVSVPTGAAAVNASYRLRVAVPTGVVFPSQDATYNGGGATGWVASSYWSRGDLVMGGSGASGPSLYSCLGPSGAGMDAGFTGLGGDVQPSGSAAAIRDGGVYWMYVGSGATGGINNDAVIQGLKSRIEYLASPTSVGTGANQLVASLQGSQGVRTLRLLANTPGKFFGLQSYDRNLLWTAQDHADPGVAADLDAINLASNAWYGLITLYNSEALIDAAAGWVESNHKLYAAASQDSAIPRVAESSATDAAHDVKAAAYARTFVAHHPSNDEFMDAAEMGKFFPVSPGGETWRMKTLAGVTVEPYTETEKSNMQAKYAHFYYELGGLNVVGGDAKVGANEYVDVIRFLDWYQSELQAKLANLVIGLSKIPFTNAGIDLIEAKVQQQNRAGIVAGGIRPGTDTVTAPDVADVSTEDKQNRELAGVVSTFELAGAIHHITANVTATP